MSQSRDTMCHGDDQLTVLVVDHDNWSAKKDGARPMARLQCRALRQLSPSCFVSLVLRLLAFLVQGLGLGAAQTLHGSLGYSSDTPADW